MRRTPLDPRISIVHRTTSERASRVMPREQRHPVIGNFATRVKVSGVSVAFSITLVTCTGLTMAASDPAQVQFAGMPGWRDYLRRRFGGSFKNSAGSALRTSANLPMIFRLA
jgi:hypothetical protein